MVFVYALTEQCADGSTENRCSESWLSDLSAEFLAPISYTSKMLRVTCMDTGVKRLLLM